MGLPQYFHPCLGGNVRRVVTQEFRHPWLGGTRRLIMYLATL